MERPLFAEDTFREIPANYTLDNQLICLIVMDYMRTKQLSSVNLEEFKKELSSLLVTKLKLPIFKLEITEENSILTGVIESTGNNPLTFTFEMLKK